VSGRHDGRRRSLDPDGDRERLTGHSPDSCPSTAAPTRRPRPQPRKITRAGQVPRGATCGNRVEEVARAPEGSHHGGRASPGAGVGRRTPAHESAHDPPRYRAAAWILSSRRRRSSRWSLQDGHWLRCWFCGIDPADVRITNLRRVDLWQTAMAEVFQELRRILKVGACVAFEVGKSSRGPCSSRKPSSRPPSTRPRAVFVLINDQSLRRPPTCGRDEQPGRTNTNRVVLIRNPGASPARHRGHRVIGGAQRAQIALF